MNIIPELKNEIEAEIAPAFLQLQKHRNDLDKQLQNAGDVASSQQTSSNDSANLSLMDFIVNCIANIDDTLMVLYLDVWRYITENKEGLFDQKDWEFMFSLLYTQYYKFKQAGCTIYRYGVFCSEYNQCLDLNSTEMLTCASKLKTIKTSCHRMIQRIKSIICDVFRCHQMKTVEFTLASKDQHGIMLVNDKLMGLINNVENKECMLNLKNAAHSNVKLDFFVSLHENIVTD
jgi:hypothetical protein